MTRLRPLAVPAAAVVLATWSPSAYAHLSRPVAMPGPTSAVSVEEHLDTGSHAAPVPLATFLPPAVLETTVEPGTPGARHAAAPTPAGAVAIGPPRAAKARGPPA